MIPWTIACQASPSMGFSRQEYWNGLPCTIIGKLHTCKQQSIENWTYHCFCSVAKLSDSLRPDRRCWTALVAQTVKRLPTMRETWVQSLSQEDLLEKEMATHSSILAWKIPWTEEPGGLQSMGSQSQDTTERLHFTSLQTVCSLSGSPVLHYLPKFAQIHSCPLNYYIKIEVDFRVMKITRDREGMKR